MRIPGGSVIRSTELFAPLGRWAIIDLPSLRLRFPRRSTVVAPERQGRHGDTGSGSSSLLSERNMRRYHAFCRRLAIVFAALALAALGSSPAAADFRRGDATRDGRVNVSDAVTQLLFLFSGGVELRCRDAADTNDDGLLNIDDALATLQLLFGSDRAGLPNAELGPDSTCDALDCADAPDAPPAVVISEIQYDPINNNRNDQRNEFVELHNRSSADIDVSGYAFTNGVRFTIPDGTMLPAGGFLIVAKVPERAIWREPAAPVVGPYEGELANGGERLTLTAPGCGEGSVADEDSVRYDDRAPWAVGADGYGRSLERIDVAAPSDDFHTWRASLSEAGTPGAENSTLGTPVRPVIAAAETVPATPFSTDSPEVRVTLDAPASAIARVTLTWERVARTVEAGGSVEMAVTESQTASTTLSATLPAAPTQTLTRYRLKVELDGGEVLDLPHEAEPAPVLNYLTYDREIETLLPLMFVFDPPAPSGLADGEREFSVVAVQRPGDPAPVLHGATTRPTISGFSKLTFLKGEEFAEQRTLNLMPPDGKPEATGGPLATHTEHFAFEIHRFIGALAPRSEWYRVVRPAELVHKHTQRITIQQVNERFMRLNDLDDSGDIYKNNKNSWEKKTNPETGLSEFLAFRQEIKKPAAEIRDMILETYDFSAMSHFSIGGAFTVNGDGVGNNHFLYRETTPEGRWRLVPWDLDMCFGSPSAPPTMMAGGEVLKPFHGQPDLAAAFRSRFRDLLAPGEPLSVEFLTAEIDSLEALLLADLSLLDTFKGEADGAARQRIIDAYAFLRVFVRQRVPTLNAALGTEG